MTQSGYKLHAWEDAGRGVWRGTLKFKGTVIREVTGPNRELLIENARIVKKQHENHPPEEIIDL